MTKTLNDLTMRDRKTTSVLALMPTISVVIPTLNCEAELRNLLMSIGRQRYGGKIEIIVVDGNSTDGTIEVAESFGAIVIEAPGSTINEALLIGLKEASGQFLWKLDSDNEILEWDAAELLVAPFLVFENLDVTFPQLVVSKTAKSYERWLTNLEICNVEKLFKNGCENINGFSYTNDLKFGISNASMIKVDSICKAGGIMSDFMLLFRMRQLGLAKAVFVENVHFNHKQDVTPVTFVTKWSRRIRSDSHKDWIVPHKFSDSFTNTSLNTVSAPDRLDNLLDPMGTAFYSLRMFARTRDLIWCWGILNLVIVALIFITSPLSAIRLYKSTKGR